MTHPTNGDCSVTETYDKINHWYGWNGGECPVHPETLVRVMHTDGGDYTDPAGKTWGWGVDGVAPTIFAFQIIRPYVPPPVTVKREVALYRHSATGSVDALDVLYARRLSSLTLTCISEPVEIEFTLLPGESAE